MLIERCARDMPAVPQHGQPRASAAPCPHLLQFTGADISCVAQRELSFFTAAAHLKVSKELSLSHRCQELIHHTLFAIDLNHWCNWKRQWWKRKGRTAGWCLLQKKFASGSQGHLRDKSPVFFDICHIYQQQPALSLKPLAKPVTVFLSASVSAASASLPLLPSHASSALLIVSFGSYSSFSLLKPATSVLVN